MRDREVIGTLAANIRKLRLEKGWSLRRLADEAGVAPNTVKNAEDPQARDASKDNPTPGPSVQNLDKIAQALGCVTWHLFLKDYDPHNPPPQEPPTARQLAFYAKLEADMRRLLEKDTQQ